MIAEHQRDRRLVHAGFFCDLLLGNISGALFIFGKSNAAVGLPGQAASCPSPHPPRPLPMLRHSCNPVLSARDVPYPSSLTFNAASSAMPAVT